MSSDAYTAIYAVVQEIPRGQVATYGQVAELAGLSGRGRQVGYALHATPDGVEIPWQRVMNAKGEVSDRSDPQAMGVQQKLLEAEGVIFDSNGRCDLVRYRWQPRLHSSIPRATAKASSKEINGNSNRKTKNPL
jgi:methylated-DNA-protein-cysteine methyltransferase-like protein